MGSPYWKIDQPNCGEQQQLHHPNQSNELSNCIPVAILLRQVNLLMLNPNSIVYSRVPGRIRIKNEIMKFGRKEKKKEKKERNIKYNKH